MVYTNKKGDQGIGTLIIFIALILVAAVAAGVLIQTASSLQSKSLDVGRQSQEKITTSLEIVQINSRDTSDGVINASLDTFEIVSRLGSGSIPIKLSDLSITVDTQSGSQTVVYQAGAYSTTTFNITYFKPAVNAGYLSPGDLVRIAFQSTYNVSEQGTATLTLLSRNGAPQPIKITTPSAMTTVTTPLYP
jgi:flagellin FlaB